MFCTDKERDTCNVEKMGCEGCYYNTDKEEKFTCGIKKLEVVKEEVVYKSNFDLPETYRYPNNEELMNKINEIIDYLDNQIKS